MGPWWPAIALILALAALYIGWSGYAASDDAAYYGAALHWVNNPPFAGHDHWATRFPLILTIAAAIHILGAGPSALLASALLWYTILLLCVRALAKRIGGDRAGWITVILIATMPVVIDNATTASCDLVEASFLVLGITLIGSAAGDDGAIWRPIGAGLCFGGAILCRETTALALLGFAPIFLLGRPVSRRALIIMAAACGLVLAGEAAFQFMMTGNAFNRWVLAFNHDSHIDRAANLEGNFLLNPVIDPLLVLLVNNEFGLLFWAAGVATAMGFQRFFLREGRASFTILAVLAIAAFLLVGALYTKLVLNPRYFMLPAIAAAVAVGVWLGSLRRSLRAFVLAALVAVNLLMLSVGNMHPRWTPEALILAAKDHPEAHILTDPETYHRALWPLRWNGLSNAREGRAQPGALFLAPADDLPPNAAIVQTYTAPPTALGHLLDWPAIRRVVPGGVARRLYTPSTDAVLVRIGDRGAITGARSPSP